MASVLILQTFDNGKAVHPYYPVIAMTTRKTSLDQPIKDDKAEAIPVINDYVSHYKALEIKINNRIEDVLSKTRSGKLAIWGAGIHTSQLLSEAILRPSAVRCIYDNDPKKVGKSLMGIDILNFPDDALEAKSEIDAILISSEASESVIYQQIKHLELYGIAVYCLYSDG